MCKDSLGCNSRIGLDEMVSWYFLTLKLTKWFGSSLRMWVAIYGRSTSIRVSMGCYITILRSQFVSPA